MLDGRNDVELIRDIRSKGSLYFQERFKNWTEIAKHYETDNFTIRQKFLKAAVRFKAVKVKKEIRQIDIVLETFTEDTLELFERAYVHNKQKNFSSFMFQGVQYDMGFAKYVMQQLKDKFKK